jgi:hypothetical protein
LFRKRIRERSYQTSIVVAASCDMPLSTQQKRNKCMHTLVQLKENISITHLREIANDDLHKKKNKETLVFITITIAHLLKRYREEET